MMKQIYTLEKCHEGGDIILCNGNVMDSQEVVDLLNNQHELLCDAQVWLRKFGAKTLANEILNATKQ